MYLEIPALFVALLTTASYGKRFDCHLECSKIGNQ